MQVLIASEVILKLVQAQEFRELSLEEFNFKKELKKLTLGLSSLERTIARQRSRLLFLVEGDAITQFFHLHANGRQRKNNFTRLRDSADDDFVYGDNMAMVQFNFFDNLLGNERDRPCILNLEAIGISPRNLMTLELPFTEEEVWGVIKELKPEKAPGPDGYIGAFYKESWAIIKDDLYWQLSIFSTTNTISTFSTLTQHISFCSQKRVMQCGLVTLGRSVSHTALRK